MKKQNKQDKFKWIVWTWNFSLDKLEEFDVVPILEGALKSLKKNERPQTFEEFNIRLHNEAMYYYWAKCEYEMILHAWPERDNDKKVDVFDQLNLNWDTFAREFWDKLYLPKILKIKKQ